MAAMSSTATLIVQQERRVADALEACVARSPGLRLAGRCSDGAQALRYIEEEEPELVCVDLHLPGLKALLDTLCDEHPDTAVLLTASEQDPAWPLLELNAVDPLPLPITRPQFQDCVEEALRLRDPGLCVRALGKLARGGPLREILVHDRGEIRPLDVRAIESLQSEHGSTVIVAGGRRYAVRLALAGFERVLDRQHFFKLHRRCIVNLEQLARVDRGDPAHLIVYLRSGVRLVADAEAAQRLRKRGF